MVIKNENMLSAMQDIFFSGEFAEWFKNKEVPFAAAKEFEEARQFFCKETGFTTERPGIPSWLGNYHVWFEPTIITEELLEILEENNLIIIREFRGLYNFFQVREIGKENDVEHTKDPNYEILEKLRQITCITNCY